MHKTHFRNVLAMILALVMSVSCFGVQDFASESAGITEETTTDMASGNGDASVMITFTNNMSWSGGTNDVLILTKTMKQLTYRSTFNLFGQHGVVVLRFELLDSNGNAVDRRSYTFACNGLSYTSDDFLFPFLKL